MKKYLSGITENVDIRGKLYPVDELMDKELWAAQKWNVRDTPNKDLGKILLTIKPGEKIGNIYSWVKGKDKTGKLDGTMWWQLVGQDFGQGRWTTEGPLKGQLKPVYVLHNKNAFSLSKLTNQGVKSTEEVIKEEKEKADEENKDWTDKLMDGIKQAAPWIALIYIGGKYVSKPNQ